MSSLFNQGARMALQGRVGCAFLFRAPPLTGIQLVRASSSSGPAGSHPVPLALKKRGYDVTRNPHLNKGMAFTLEERLQLGIHGLIPPCFLSQDVQLLRVMRYYEKQPSDLDKYIILMTLQDRNEKLFYRVLTSDVEKFMPIVYTPTVGLACQQYGLTFRRPRGLFITIHDKGHIATMLNSWPEDNIKIIVSEKREGLEVHHMREQTLAPDPKQRGGLEFVTSREKGSFEDQHQENSDHTSLRITPPWNYQIFADP
uniref:Malic enzyme 3 n=1 Tax=Sarcophilus harrisii TaxID=9305 RepID=A0A7N4PJ07_SARHA